MSMAAIWQPNYVAFDEFVTRRFGEECGQPPGITRTLKNRCNQLYPASKSIPITLTKP
jgi:hypothetical protein